MIRNRISSSQIKESSDKIFLENIKRSTAGMVCGTQGVDVWKC